MNQNKLIAFYLPQFHEIPENNMFWGKGFTEWNNVKGAFPLFDGHDQPRIPLNSQYYDLNNVEVIRQQVELAKEAGLYGFCFYHYWFNGKPVMYKPLINYLNNKDIDFPFCFSWANESWNNGWAKADQKTILKQEYGDYTEWKLHFDFMLPFFKDNRYIKENNKPVLIIYRPYQCGYMLDILKCWNELAVEQGFNGITFMSQRFEIREDKALYEYFDNHIEYEPGFVWAKQEYEENKVSVKSRFHDFILRRLNIDMTCLTDGPKFKDYDATWRRILELQPESYKSIPGAFVDWDNSPRHKKRGVICKGTTPQKFQRYLKMQIINMNRKYHTSYMFIFAWNEWGEGGYIEPDQSHGKAYIQALANAQIEAERANENN